MTSRVLRNFLLLLAALAVLVSSSSGRRGGSRTGADREHSPKRGSHRGAHGAGPG